jgi:hypothetical protein
MTIGHALELVKKGYKVTTPEWESEGLLMYIELYTSEESGLTYDIFTLCCVEYNNSDVILRTPWTPNQTDLQSDEWIVLEI